VLVALKVSTLCACSVLSFDRSDCPSSPSERTDEVVTVKVMVTLALPPSLSCAMNSHARHRSTKRLDTNIDAINLIVTTTSPQTRYSE
jgi:hypothetical protein